MWQNMLEQLMTTEELTDNLFWPDVDRHREHLMLWQLFTTALTRNVLVDDEVDRFLSGMAFMTGIAPDGRTEIDFSATMHDAMAELLDMDQKLSPLSLTLFGRRLIPESDRDLLRQDIGMPPDIMNGAIVARVMTA